jgi:hypothetical protein
LNWKTEPFPGQLFIAFFLSNCFGSKGSADVSTAKALNCFSYGAHFTATISLHAVTKPTVTPHGTLWPYKSQRKATTERGKKRRKTQRTGGTEKKRRRGTEKLKKGKKERRTKRENRTYNTEGCTEDTRRNKHREEQNREHKNTEEPERRTTREKPKKGRGRIEERSVNDQQPHIFVCFSYQRFCVKVSAPSSLSVSVKVSFIHSSHFAF